MLKNLKFKKSYVNTYIKSFKFYLKGYIDANNYALIKAKNEELELLISLLEQEKSQNSICAHWCWKTLLLIVFLITILLFIDYNNFISSSITLNIINILQWPLLGLFIIMAITHHDEKFQKLLDIYKRKEASKE